MYYVQRYLSEWPDINGLVYRVPLYPDPELRMHKKGACQTQLNVMHAEYALKSVVYNNLFGYVWELTNIHDEIYVIENEQLDIPIAFEPRRNL